VIVQTRHGKLEGFSSGGLQVFRGVPFARPPVGDLRFRPPEAPEPWTGVRPASEFGASAQQGDLFAQVYGWDIGKRDEDCLYLNVTTPGADAARRPVLVWIHGGIYIVGSGSQGLYDAETLVQRGDVVVVTINYRLGAFGFLHLNDLLGREFGASGNAGTLDQLAALRWVRDNIEAFGGDPANVTIFGESAGGMSVATLMGMPSAAGLFRRAIPQSGAAHAVSTRERATQIAAGLLDELGIALGDATRLRGISAGGILAGRDKLSGAAVGAGDGSMDYQPVVDGDALPQPPLDAIRAGSSANIDMLIGTTRDEWNLFSALDPSQSQIDEKSMTEKLVGWMGPEAEGIIEIYREARGPDIPAKDIFNAILTDRIFRIPALRLAEAKLAHPACTYCYLFTWESPLAALGACHLSDIPFVFGSAGKDAIGAFTKGGAEAKALAAKVMDAWLAFARTGDPNHPGLDPWPGYDRERRATMFFGKACQVVDAPQDAERLAWQGIL